MKGDFMWAVAQMKKGKKVRRPYYKEIGWYIKDGGEWIGTTCGKEPIINSISNFEATDWEIAEDKKTLRNKLDSKTKVIDGLVYIRLVDVLELNKEAIKEFIVKYIEANVKGNDDPNLVRIAKEIFGERLV